MKKTIDQMDGFAKSKSDKLDTKYIKGNHRDLIQKNIRRKSQKQILAEKFQMNLAEIIH